MNAPKSTLINQLPKQPMANNQGFMEQEMGADGMDKGNGDEDVAIQEVLAEINAQNRATNPQISQMLAGQQQTAPRQEMFMQPPQMMYQSPLPQQQTMSHQQQPYFNPMSSVGSGYQQQMAGYSPPPPSGLSKYASMILEVCKSDLTLFVIIAVVVLVMSHPSVTSLIVNNFAYVNIPYIDLILKAVVTGVLVIVLKKLAC
jgi:uncharacterized integral membrane protein